MQCAVDDLEALRLSQLEVRLDSRVDLRERALATLEDAHRIMNLGWAIDAARDSDPEFAHRVDRLCMRDGHVRNRHELRKFLEAAGINVMGEALRCGANRLHVEERLSPEELDLADAAIGLDRAVDGPAGSAFGHEDRVGRPVLPLVGEAVFARQVAAFAYVEHKLRKDVTRLLLKDSSLRRQLGVELRRATITKLRHLRPPLVEAVPPLTAAARPALVAGSSSHRRSRRSRSRTRSRSLLRRASRPS